MACRTPVQPVTIIQRAMSMFRPEVTSKDIKFDFITDASFQRLNIDWVNLDPGRLLQITVNLITNAIKFTSPSAKRNISVYISASVERPDLQEKGFEYVPLRVAVPDVTAGEDWGDGEIVHIHVEVKDTGCGLTPEEKDKLFERFAQASQRTHVQYGGSGLGLFISRQLSELHGGRIGVSSEAGVGSTFAFFIRARRVPTPSSALQTISPIQATSPMHSTSPINPTSLIQVTSSIQNASPIQNTSPLQATSPTQATSPVQATSPEQATSPIKTDSSVPAFDSPEPSPPPTINAPTLESSKPEPQINQDTADTSLHVLLVEDNLVNQRVVSKQLKKAGCHVTTAENGVFALKHLATTHFQKPGSGVPLSIVFCDWEMPEMDGLTCVARIREMQAKGEIQGHVPVIGVTANVRGEQIAQARKAGMDDVVGKPFRVPQLLIKARELLDRLAEEALTSAT
jgi:CheY-like chemotaxis protein